MQFFRVAFTVVTTLLTILTSSRARHSTNVTNKKDYSLAWRYVSFACDLLSYISSSPASAWCTCCFHINTKLQQFHLPFLSKHNNKPNHRQLPGRHAVGVSSASTPRSTTVTVPLGRLRDNSSQTLSLLPTYRRYLCVPANFKLGKSTTTYYHTLAGSTNMTAIIGTLTAVASKSQISVPSAG